VATDGVALRQALVCHGKYEGARIGSCVCEDSRKILKWEWRQKEKKSTTTDRESSGILERGE